MTGPDSGPWSLALKATSLLAVDPEGLGGVVIRSGPSPALDALIAHFRALTPAPSPWRKLPAGASLARLAGGLDLAATLASGRPLFERGLLADADGGVIIAPMAERIDAEAAALIAAALDEKCVRTERDGFSRIEPARFTLLLIDEGASPEEAAPARLTERLAFAIDLTGLRGGSDGADAPAIERARDGLIETKTPDEVIEALAVAALRHGVLSIRALQFALAAARASAALAGRRQASGEDAALAAALVIAPRAVIAPDSEAQAASETPSDVDGDQSEQALDGPLEDQVIGALKAVIDADLLSMDGHRRTRAQRARTAGKSGAARKSVLQGRPIGARRGDPSKSGRLALIDTLRAAAPWQKIRGRTDAAEPIAIRRDDMHVARMRRREQSLTIFVVDASGSAAMQRLGETKGAIEHLFARSYSRRDEVALIAFRKSGAELLVPPTRSLTRARRLLAELPGGGGTPLAAGIDAASLLAAQASARGRTPTIVLMTDGRANVALSGEGGREIAQRDAIAAARRLRARDLRVLLIDNSIRPEPLAAALAREMGAAYLPLPQSDSRLIAAAVAPAGSRAR